MISLLGQVVPYCPNTVSGLKIKTKSRESENYALHSKANNVQSFETKA